MNAASGTAARETPDHGTDLNAQPNTPARSPAPRFPTPHHRAPWPAASRTPYGAAPGRPGSARSLTQPATRHGHGSYQETADASYPCPHAYQNQGKTILDTAPLLQG